MSDVAVVTGAAQGIGFSYARGLAERGDQVVIADIDGDAARRAAATLNAGGVRATGLAVDVGDPDSVAAMAASVEAQHGRLDALVNNAALMLTSRPAFKPFWEMDWSEWSRFMAVNAGGVFLCTSALLPLLRRSDHASVVNVASDGIWLGLPGQMAYFASKAAVDAMTKNMARELGPLGIRVNAIAPGLTESAAVVACPDMAGPREGVVGNRAIPRRMVPDDLVGTLLFLCSGAAGAMTGQTLLVNCGAVMR